MVKNTIILILPLLYAGMFTNSESQSFELDRNNASIIINGTSTLHKWDMHLKAFDCKADFLMEGSRLRSIENVSFSCNTTDLTSDNSLMDKKAYAAMNAPVFPEISFKMTSATEILTGNAKFSSSMRGNLLVAGKSVSVSIPVEGAVFNENGYSTITVSGETELKMSDFGISPPVLMLGALKTGDRIMLTFSLKFLQKQEQSI